MSITYRKLTAADASTYRAIRLESLRLHPQSFGSKYEEQKELPKLRFEAVLEQGVANHFVMGAFNHDQLIGICGFIPFFLSDEHDLKKIGTLIQVYVKAAYSGQKIGLGLIQATIQAAFQQPDIEQIILEVNLTNLPAIRVYEQAGFQQYSLQETEGRASQLMIIYRENDDAEQ